MAGIPLWAALFLAVTTELVFLQSGSTQDDLRQSPRVGAFRIPLTSYERIPIGTLLANPDRYQMREIRVAGTVIVIQTEIVTNRMVCGRSHERTTLIIEDDTGKIEVVDLGACGKNVGALKAPMVKVGQQVDLLVQTMIPTNSGGSNSPVEATIRYVDLVRE